MENKDCFWLHSGESLCTLDELCAALKTMPASVFLHHVTGYKNDFAQWVGDVLKEEEIATALHNVHTAQEMIDVICGDYENEEEETAQPSSNNEKKEELDSPQEPPNVKEQQEHSPVSDAVFTETQETTQETHEEQQSAESAKSTESTESPEDAKYFGDAGTKYREDIAERFAEAHKRFVLATQHIVSDTLQKKYEILIEKEKEIRLMISEARKAGFDLYVADITLQRFRAMLDLAQATEDTNDLKAIDALFETVLEEIEYAKAHPAPNVKKEIEAMVNPESAEVAE